MGIVNATPDSFYPASRSPSADEAVRTALRLRDEGADILDVGGESARPGSRPVSAEEEAFRVVPVIERVRAATDALLSIDTQKASVAERALEAGADIVNDVSGLVADPRMAEVTAKYEAGLVLMHMKGTPETMQRAPVYRDVVTEVRDFLEAAVRRAEAAGVRRDGIVVDPGIGFGKTLEHNLGLLKELPALAVLGKPILVGTSRKSFLGRLLGHPEADRLLGTAASVAAAIWRGAHLVRVHDVREMVDVVRVTDAIRAGREPARTVPGVEGAAAASIGGPPAGSGPRTSR